MIKLSDNLEEKKQAKIPHELFTLNIIIVHIFLPAGLMKLGGIGYALIIPILISLTIIAFTYFKTKQVKLNKPYFVYLHWQQSVNWYRPILIVYGISILIFLLGIFISNNSQENMQAIVSKVFILLSLIPLFFTVLTAFVVESGYLFSAGRGEVLQKMIDKYPNHQANS